MQSTKGKKELSSNILDHFTSPASGKVKRSYLLTHFKIFCKLSIPKISHFVKRSFSCSKKNLHRTTFWFLLLNFRMCTKGTEPPTPFNCTSRTRVDKNITLSTLFWRIAKRYKDAGISCRISQAMKYSLSHYLEFYNAKLMVVLNELTFDAFV